MRTFTAYTLLVVSSTTAFTPPYRSRSRAREIPCHHHQQHRPSTSSPVDGQPERVPSDEITLLNNERVASADSPLLNNRGNPTSRRKLVQSTLTATTLTFFLPDQPPKHSAFAIDNPLNLKGTFWETGQLYEKKTTAEAILESASDPSDFVPILESMVESFHAPVLVDAITEGRFGDASRLLRGGLISESKIRIAANALIDEIPEEEDDKQYLASESFREFIRYFDGLDALMESASRPFGGGEDPRMNALTLLGEVEESLRMFVKIAK